MALDKPLCAVAGICPSALINTQAIALWEPQICLPCQVFLPGKTPPFRDLNLNMELSAQGGSLLAWVPPWTAGMIGV